MVTHGFRLKIYERVYPVSPILLQSAVACSCYLCVWVFCSVLECTPMRDMLTGQRKKALDPPGYGWLWAATWVLGTEPKSSAAVASEVNHWAISPALTSLHSYTQLSQEQLSAHQGQGLSCQTVRILKEQLIHLVDSYRSRWEPLENS